MNRGLIGKILWRLCGGTPGYWEGSPPWVSFTQRRYLFFTIGYNGTGDMTADIMNGRGAEGWIDG
jgi:hypothetical protein